MPLEFATLNFAGALASLLAALALTMLALGNRNEPALRWFAGAAIAGAVGLLAFWLFEPPRPVLPRILANVVLIADLGAILIGVLIFSERRVSPWRLELAIAGGTAIAFGLIWLMGDAFVLRLWLFALLAAALGFAIATALTGAHWYTAELERWSGARRMLAALFAVHGVFQVVRALAVTAQGSRALQNWLDPGWIHVASAIDGIVLSAVFAWGVAAMHGQKVAAALHRLAHRDALTALPNRIAFRELFDTPRKGERPDASSVLVILDLDDFKMLNDASGHAFGDAVLEQVGARLQAALRPEDAVARLGGDEFVVLLHGVTGDTAEGVVRRMTGDLANVRIGETALTISCSAGLAERPADGNDFDTLYRVADTRLYEAKRQGKGLACRPDGGTFSTACA